MAKREPSKSEQTIEAAQLERQLARDAFKAGNRELAWTHLRQVLHRLSQNSLAQENEALFAESCLGFSDLCFVLGQGFNDSMRFLQIARYEGHPEAVVVEAVHKTAEILVKGHDLAPRFPLHPEEPLRRRNAQNTP